MLRQATYTTPVTALYARLSKDDEQQGPSLSIENQKRILETFARDNGFLNCRFFVDDGWSGANFQRPGFMEMMDCVESGEVKCVITKDLSRMGRNYLQVGMFTEITFPKKGVRFIVDEEAAPVVKQIYDLCLAGNGPSKIARVLTEQGVPTPGTLEYRRTGSTRRYHPGYECKWATNTIVHILERKEYLGHLVNFKTEKVSYKVKSSVENPEEKQVIFENAHEPIIDPDTWERVQELRKQRKRPNRYDEVGLFSGLLFCADCGSVLYQQRYENKTRKQDCYICGNYKKRTHDCTAHFIRTDLLTAGVTANLKKITAYAAKHEKQFMKLLVQQNEDGGKRRNAAKKRELEAAEKRIGELSAIFKRLYEDSVAGRITDERFSALSADYEAEQRQVREHAAELQAELSKAQEASVNAERFMNIVRRHISFEELTPTLLREFIEKIVVHECSYDENKHRRQEIEIYYSFVGKVDLPDE